VNFCWGTIIKLGCGSRNGTHKSLNFASVW